MKSIAAAALAAALSLPTQAANLLTNASFENPGCAGNCILGGGSTFVTGWTTVLSGAEYFNAPAFGFAGVDGVMVVDLANFVFSAGGIQQSFVTAPGQQYTLSFYAGNSLSSGRTGTGDVRVQVGNVDVVLQTPVALSAAIAWSLVSVDFVAQSSQTTLTFSNLQNANLHFALIDGIGVDVAAVPEPGSWALVAGGLLGLAALGRRRAGAGATR